MIRLVSINVWDLPIPFPWGDRKRRTTRILERLPELEIDIVVVQEAFRPEFKTRLAGALPGFHADSFVTQRRRSLWMTFDRAGGLLVLSRWPIARSVFEPSPVFRGMRIDERIGRKGSLWTEITTPDGPVTLAAVHLFAGNSARDARVRSEQVRHLLNARALDGARPTVLAGDFNMAAELEAPDRGPSGFHHLQQRGFEEIAGGKTGQLATMSPRRNVYAARIQRFRHDRRLTQVFYRGLRPGPEAPRICLHDPPVSDHFGLRVTLATD